MEIDHFSHEHRLILEEEHKHDDGGDGDSDGDIQRSRTCYVCSDLILDADAYYSCRECDLYFSLHKYCAELPQEMDHHFHPQHKLILRPYRNRCCNACRFNCGNLFVYNCSECDFDLDIICATLMQRKINHKSHQHPLILLQTPGLFKCLACNTDHKGFFFICPTCCLFFLHEDCAKLPTTIKHCDDEHPLVLAYSIPSQYRTFRIFCNICTKRVLPHFWVYYCDRCRFFAHVNCATSKIEPFMSIFLPRRTSKVITEEEQVEDSGSNVIRFPVMDQSVTIISYILSGMTLTNNIETANQLNHFSHHHPLILVVEGSDDNESCSKTKLCDLLNDPRVDETICNACVKPIFATPFYRCANDQCNFFLHKCCAELPTEIDQHPYHPHHPLILLPKSSNFFNLFKCEGCHSFCNGFCYHCTCCDFYLDVQCASLPSTITHEAHHPNHVLSLRSKFSNRCNACQWSGRNKPILAYGCTSCDYELDSCCALLSHTVRHRYDEHPFILTYSPIKDHSYDYNCEICQRQLDPKKWFYHCIECDRSIHIKCLRPFYSGSNIKYGKTLNVKRHKHPLALGPVVDTRVSNSFRVIGRLKTNCNACGTYFTNSMYSGPPYPFGFRCEECTFTLCYRCAKSWKLEQRQ